MGLKLAFAMEWMAKAGFSLSVCLCLVEQHSTLSFCINQTNVKVCKSLNSNEFRSYIFSLSLKTWHNAKLFITYSCGRVCSCVCVWVSLCGAGICIYVRIYVYFVNFIHPKSESIFSLFIYQYIYWSLEYKLFMVECKRKSMHVLVQLYVWHAYTTSIFTYTHSEDTHINCIGFPAYIQHLYWIAFFFSLCLCLSVAP